jgi:very-short-patch-repair endonuclease
MHALGAAVARYHAGCLKVIGAQNVGQRDLRTTKKAAYPCDVGRLLDREDLLRLGRCVVHAPEHPGEGASREALDEYGLQFAVWERLVEVAAKARVEAHQKEIIYGAPLLEGVLPKKGKNGNDAVLAPLFLQNVTVEAEADGTVVIEGTDEPPRFNTSLWTDTVGAAGEDIVTLGINAQARLAEGWDDERVAELLEAIRARVPFVVATDLTGDLNPWPNRPAPAEIARSQAQLRLVEGAGVYLANKASPYLLADLGRIADTPTAHISDNSPLSVLLSPPADELAPEIDQPDIDEVIYPFPSNGPQRKVADAVDKNAIVVVQGPPGNGKSLTIANLVAHLVAEGKRVLVCSHKEQALVVVRDKLNELQLDFLYASMIGSGMEAKRALQGQIQNVKAFSTKVNQKTLRQQLADTEQRRAENGAIYRELRDEFNERAEADQVEAEELALAVEGIPVFPIEDPVPDDERLVGEALQELDRLARAHPQAWAFLTGSELASEGDLAQLAENLDRFISLQRSRIAAAKDSVVRGLVAQWQPVLDRRDEAVDQLQSAIESVEDALQLPLAGIDDDPFPDQLRTTIKRAASDPRLLQELWRARESLSERVDEAQVHQEARSLVKADITRRAEVVEQRLAAEKLFAKGRARKWLNDYAPGAAGLTIEQVQQWRAFWDTWQLVGDEVDALGDLSPVGRPESYRPADVSVILAHLDRALAVGAGLAEARATTRQFWDLDLSVDHLATTLRIADLHETLRAWRLALEAARADQIGNDLLTAEALGPLAQRAIETDAASDQGRFDEAARQLAWLEIGLAALPDLERRRALVGSVGTFGYAIYQLEVAASAASPRPDWLEHLDESLAAHPKRKRLSEIAADDSTRELAEEVRELRDQVLADARMVLMLRTQERIYDGNRSPKFNASIEQFKRAVRASAKRFDRIEELKNSANFDADVLTRVFPCWIMRPEDACRFFPLQSDLFDVVIFDEASQCNPDQTLPVLARARKVVVFGDQNQLSNTDITLQLSANANKSLIAQAGLEEFATDGMFNQLETSLLGMMARRDQAPILLTEHFRCRPEIVAFSNERFYAGDLRVMRDVEDDHGLGPAFLIRELTDLPPIGKLKINEVEADALVDELVELLDDPRYAGCSFGVLSLFREQIEFIEALVERRIPKSMRERHRLICSTVDGFQGDERDVILYSWRWSPDQSVSVMSFTDGTTGDQRVNVALTRARHQAIHYVSAPIAKFPKHRNVGGYLHHVAEPTALITNLGHKVHREPLTEARRRTAQALREAGFEVQEHYVACGLAVDFVVRDTADNSRVAVFIDGQIHPTPPATADRRIDGQGLLERAGWTVVRLLAEEAVAAGEEVLDEIRMGLADCGARPTLSGEVETYRTVSAAALEIEGEGEELPSLATIAPEDRADYHWDAPSIDARLAAGDTVFMSDFERALCDQLSTNEDLLVVPQWPSRNKLIDLVITDRQGRRLAIEADGDVWHQDIEGHALPEDLDRQALLEEAGWTFHRVTLSDWQRDDTAITAAVMQALAAQPPNPQLAAAVFGAPDLGEELEAAPEPETVITQPSHPGASAAAQRTVSADAVRQRERTSPGESPSLDGASPEEPVGPVEQPVVAAKPLATGTTSPTGAIHFDDLPLAAISAMISLTVIERGAISDDELPAAFEDRWGVDTGSRRSLFKSFVWSAGGRRFIERDDETSCWSAGRKEPDKFNAIDDRWSINTARNAADGHGASADREAAFHALCDEIWQSDKRLPKPIYVALKIAVDEAAD